MNDRQKQKENIPEAEIHVVKHSKLFEVLSKPRMLWRTLISLFLLFVVLIGGLSCVVLIIKSHYPYNQIETTEYGATIIKSEDKEVIYWLLNTADVWSNSGIEVKAGDELTIRASGMSHAAIHHLVKNAGDNEVPSIRWQNANGQDSFFDDDPLQGKYRLGKYQQVGMLLMHIFSNENSNNNPTWINTVESSVLNDPDNTFAIGQERRNLKVPRDGFLHFSINDILLTDTVIHDIYSEYFDYLCENFQLKGLVLPKDSTISDYKNKVLEIVDKIGIIEQKKGQSNVNNYINHLEGINKKLFDREKYVEMAKMSKDKVKRDSLRKEGLSEWFDPYMIGRDCDSTGSKGYPLVTELIYYKEHHFRNAWFVDNLGSFLVIIERPKH